MTIHDKLKAIKARCDAATKGPWRAVECGYNLRHDDRGEVEVHTANSTIIVADLDCGHCNKNATVDSDFIAYARTDVPQLVAALEIAVKALDYIGRIDLETCASTVTAKQALAEIEAILNSQTLTQPHSRVESPPA